MRRRSCTLFCLFFLSALMCLQRSMRICDMWYSPMLSSKLHGFPPFIELFLLSKLVFKRLDIEGLFFHVLPSRMFELPDISDNIVPFIIEAVFFFLLLKKNVRNSFSISIGSSGEERYEERLRDDRELQRQRKHL